MVDYTFDFTPGEPPKDQRQYLVIYEKEYKTSESLLAVVEWNSHKDDERGYWEEGGYGFHHKPIGWAELPDSALTQEVKRMAWDKLPGKLPPIFLITGLAGSGKDTVGKHLIEKWGAERVALADPLRWIFEEIYEEGIRLEGYGVQKDISVSYLDGKTPRDVLKCIGKGGRRYDPSIWSIVAVSKIRGKDEKVIAVTDVRFPNELKVLSDPEWIGDRTVCKIRIVREGFKKDSRHSDNSEQALNHLADNKFDIVLTSAWCADVNEGVKGLCVECENAVLDWANSF